jgi:hypothetical protein
LLGLGRDGNFCTIKISAVGAELQQFSAGASDGG